MKDWVHVHKTVPTPLDHFSAAVYLDMMCLDMSAMVLIIYELLKLNNMFWLTADVNECLPNEGLGPCAQNCTNTIGSFQCSCLPGYTVSGYACNGEMTRQKAVHHAKYMHEYVDAAIYLH